MQNLQYKNERDKAYGLAGMAVGIRALDGEEYIAYIDLDADTAESFRFTPEFSFHGNPRMSAKIVWQQTLNDLRLIGTAIVANLECRRRLLDHGMPAQDEYAACRDALRLDAKNHLDLDDDEIDALFESCRNYAVRLFRHQGVCDLTHSFAARIIERRKLSGAEAVELLAALGLR